MGTTWEYERAMEVIEKMKTTQFLHTNDQNFEDFITSMSTKLHIRIYGFKKEVYKWH